VVIAALGTPCCVPLVQTFIIILFLLVGSIINDMIPLMNHHHFQLAMLHKENSPLCQSHVGLIY